MRKSVDLVFITLSSPILVGVYEDNELIDSIKSDEKSSECLPILFDKLAKTYDIKALFYANGPGSFMAIKIAYIFLKSISIIKNIPLYATDAFYFNKNQPIKAIGKLFFVKISSEIKTEKFKEAPKGNFELPKVLNVNDFSQETTPLYSIDAVGN